jgi:transcriptional regulator with XRE-family HTH domain
LAAQERNSGVDFLDSEKVHGETVVLPLFFMKISDTKKSTDIAEALRLFRVFHDLTLAELASKLDVSSSFLSSVETGRKKPNLNLIEKYASVFGTTTSAIIFFSEELCSPRFPKSLTSRVRTRLIKFMQAIENGKAE